MNKTVDLEMEREEEGQHCTAACQHANKIECVCGCGGKNHGIKSMIKMDSFFTEEEEEEQDKTDYLMFEAMNLMNEIRKEGWL